MTREEAKEILTHNWTRVDNPNYSESELDEAFFMAIEALSAEHKHCWDCKHYEPKYNVCHAPEVVKQVTSKLKKPCDSLLTDESNGSKEHKSKLDLISRADAIEAVAKLQKYDLDERNRLRIYAPWHKPKRIFVETEAIYKTIYALPSADAVQGVWEHIESTWADNIFKCSKCGNPVKIPTVDGEPIYDYCVCCGAKMGNVWGERND